MPALKADRVDPPPRAPFRARALAGPASFALVFRAASALGFFRTGGMVFALSNAAFLLAGGLISGAAYADLDRRHAARTEIDEGLHG